MTHREMIVRKYEAFLQLLIVQDKEKFKILYAFLTDKKNIPKVCYAATDVLREKVKKQS